MSDVAWRIAVVAFRLWQRKLLTDSELADILNKIGPLPRE